MPTAICRPSATGTYNDWTLGAGGSKQAALDPGNPVSHDDDTTYCSIGTSPGSANKQSVYLDTGMPSGIATVNQVDFYTRSRTTGTPSVESTSSFIRRDTSESTPVAQVETGSYQNNAQTSISRPGGGSWVPADFVSTNIQGAIGVGTANAQPMRCTSIWVELDYRFLVGGYLQLLVPTLGPLVALLLRDMPGIARVVYSRTSQIIKPEEYLEALAEYRSYAWPKRFVLG